jgi:hypothetical protein
MSTNIAYEHKDTYLLGLYICAHMRCDYICAATIHICADMRCDYICAATILQVRMLVSKWNQTKPQTEAYLQVLRSAAAACRVNVYATSCGTLSIKIMKIPGWDSSDYRSSHTSSLPPPPPSLLSLSLSDYLTPSLLSIYLSDSLSLSLPPPPSLSLSPFLSLPLSLSTPPPPPPLLGGIRLTAGRTLG